MRKLVQLKVYSFLSSRWGMSFCIIGAFITFISFFQILQLIITPGSLTRSTDWTDNVMSRDAEKFMCSEPIDIVYTWVNGSDPLLIEAVHNLKMRLRDPTIPHCNSTQSPDKDNCFNDEDTQSRFVDNEELKFSLRSIEAFAPWVRHIYIVTNGQVPSWLDLSHPKLFLITHEDIFVNKSHLPTFSSPSIEVHLHRIPGLSNKFIYLNDDVMFGRTIYPDDFYTSNAGQKVFLSWAVPNCAEGCPSNWIGDGYCDLSCNVSACDFDANDCKNYTGSSSSSGSNRWNPSSSGSSAGDYANRYKNYCAKGCPDSWIGDKYCDRMCKNLECGFDAGDCGVEDIYGSMYGITVMRDGSHYEIPQGTPSAYFNLTELIGVNATITDGSHDNSQLVRTATISQKHKIMTLTFHRNITQQMVMLSVTAEREVNGSKAVIQVHFNATLDTVINETAVAEEVPVATQAPTMYDFSHRYRGGPNGRSGYGMNQQHQQDLQAPLTSPTSINATAKPDGTQNTSLPADSPTIGHQFSTTVAPSSVAITNPTIIPTTTAPLSSITTQTSLNGVGMSQTASVAAQTASVAAQTSHPRTESLVTTPTIPLRTESLVTTQKPAEATLALDVKPTEAIPGNIPQPEKSDRNQEPTETHSKLADHLRANAPQIPDHDGKQPEEGRDYKLQKDINDAKPKLGDTVDQIGQGGGLPVAPEDNKVLPLPVADDVEIANGPLPLGGPEHAVDKLDDLADPNSKQEAALPVIAIEEKPEIPKDEVDEGGGKDYKLKDVQYPAAEPAGQMLPDQQVAQPEKDSNTAGGVLPQKSEGGIPIGGRQLNSFEPGRRLLSIPIDQDDGDSEEVEARLVREREAERVATAARKAQELHAMQFLAKKHEEQEKIRLENLAYDKLLMNEEGPAPWELGNQEVPAFQPSRRKLLDMFGDSLKYVNKLYNTEFGPSARKVPAHMPHMIDKRIMEELQQKWPQEWEKTSTHSLRNPQDMQYAFAYFYFLIHQIEEYNITSVWQKHLDLDKDGVLNKNEIRTLAVHIHSAPLSPEQLADVSGTLRNSCLVLQQKKGIPAETVEGQPEPCNITLEVLESCNKTSSEVKRVFSKLFKYKHQIEGTDEVAFLMIGNNETVIQGKLDGIRIHRQKFICLNDNMNHTDPESDKVVEVLHDFYMSILPKPSRFELPPGKRNAFAYIHEIRQSKTSDTQKKGYATAIGVIALLALAFIIYQCVAYTRTLDRRAKTRRANKLLNS